MAITDKDWYEFLSKIKPDEVNFWQPSVRFNFRAINPGELFLFKLHSPDDYIAGGGFFVRQSFLPLSITWKVFENKNGADSIETFEKRMYKYRKTSKNEDPDPVVSSLILAQPFFFERKDWISISKIWAKSIQTGKTYDTEKEEGKELYKEVIVRISGQKLESETEIPILNEQTGKRYGKEQIILPRLGQGAFRVVVTEAYNRKCAISGEKTLPVLDAAHIKPFKKQGPNVISNGILLRQDMHTLFDRGFITITKDFVIEVSKKIKIKYGNGREYYLYNGKKLISLPENKSDIPSVEFLKWHNKNIYVG